MIIKEACKLQAPLKDIQIGLLLKGQTTRWYSSGRKLIMQLQVGEFVEHINLKKPALYRKLSQVGHDLGALIIQDDAMYLRRHKYWDDDDVKEIMAEWKHIVEAPWPSKEEALAGSGKSTPD